MKGSLAGRGTLSLQREMKLDYGQAWRQSNSRKCPLRRAIGEDVKIGSRKGCCAVRSVDALVFTGRHIPEKGLGWKQDKNNWHPTVLKLLAVEVLEVFFEEIEDQQLKNQHCKISANLILRLTNKAVRSRSSGQVSRSNTHSSGGDRTSRAVSQLLQLRLDSSDNRSCLHEQ